MQRAARPDCDYAALALPGVRALEPYQPGTPIERLERELGITGAVKLASNENPLGPGARALEAMRAALPMVGRYPDGSGCALKEALASHLSKGSISISPAQITLGNGSNEVLELVARAFAGPAHEVIYSEHGFAVYPLVTRAVGAGAVVVPARAYGHDLAAMAAAVTKRTRLLFIANPNNPTGTWVDEAALVGLLEAVPPELLVVLDEAYFEYVDAPGYFDGMGWLARFPNLIVTRTFSKVHGLAGLRVGYAVSHPAVAEVLNRVREPFNVNAVGLVAAAAALADEAHLRASVALNREGLRQLESACDGLGLSYIPSVANFLCIDLGRPALAVYEALLQRGVIVRPVANYGLPRHLRVSVGQPAENERFIRALAGVVAGDARPVASEA